MRVYPQDSPERPASGTLAVIDNVVDTTTGTIKLKATFDNKDGMLWPGQFVTAVLTLDTLVRRGHAFPPKRCRPGRQGQYVYVVKADNTVELRPVTVGSAFGAQAGDRKGRRARRDRWSPTAICACRPARSVQLVDAEKLGAGKS